MNAQHLAIGRAIERLHALQTFTRKGSARTVALEVEQYALTVELTKRAQEICGHLMVGMAETVGDWSSTPLTKFDREGLRAHDTLDEIISDRNDHMEAYAAENGEQAPGEYGTLNVAQQGLTSAVARV